MASCPTCGKSYEGVQFCALDGARLVADSKPTSRVGEILADRYRLLEKAGEGAMGVVYRAEHLYIQRQLAIKLLRRELASHAEAIKRLQREAHATSGIGHPNIVRIEDFGHLEDGTVFLAMEWLEGSSLEDLMESGPIDLRSYLEIATQVCRGLTAAHDQGIVHRDLKPANVFITKDKNGVPLAKLVDFGIARLMHTDSDLTKSGTFMGTPYYMPPEQAKGDEVTHTGDIYSMGVILYEMATGVLPYDADTFVGVLHQKTAGPPPPPSDRVPSRKIPKSLEATIMRALKMSPDERQQSAAELEADIETTIAELGGRSAPRGKRRTMPGVAASAPPQQDTNATADGELVANLPTLPAGDSAPLASEVGAAPPAAETTRPSDGYAPPAVQPAPPAGTAPLASGGGYSPPAAQPAQTGHSRPDRAASAPIDRHDPFASRPADPESDPGDSMFQPARSRGKLAFVIILICLLGAGGVGVTMLLLREKPGEAVAANGDAGATQIASNNSNDSDATASGANKQTVFDASVVIAEAPIDATVAPAGGIWLHSNKGKNFDFDFAVSPRILVAGQPARIAVTLSNTKGKVTKALADGNLSVELEFTYYKGHSKYPGPRVLIDSSGRAETSWTPSKDGKWHVLISLVSDGRNLDAGKCDVCVGADPDASAAELRRKKCPNLNPRKPRKKRHHDH